jgi:hypothetical protein
MDRGGTYQQGHAKRGVKQAVQGDSSLSYSYPWWSQQAHCERYVHENEPVRERFLSLPRSHAVIFGLQVPS